MNKEQEAMCKRSAMLALQMHPRPSQVTQKQAAEMLNKSTATISRMVKRGELKLSRSGLIPISEIDQALQTQ